MRSSSPIIPPNSPLQRTLPGSNRKFVFTVSAILALHMFLLTAVLIQGCKRQDETTPMSQDTGMDSDLEPLTNTEISEVPPDGTSPQFGTPVPDAPVMTTPSQTEPARPGYSAPQAPATATSPEVNNPPETVTTPPTIQPPEPPLTVDYQVKAGDTLTRIARNHQTTVKAIRDANNLKTDRILVGQKLKVPQGSTAGTDANR